MAFWFLATLTKIYEDGVLLGRQLFQELLVRGINGEI
jgi:hypothetical protein